jgi:hypothetical protein
LKPLKTYKTDEKYDISLHDSSEIIEQNITGYDKKFDNNFTKQIYTSTMYSLSRSTLHYVLTAQFYTRTVYLLSTYTLKLLSLRVLPPTRRTGRASHLHHLLPHSLLLFPLSFLFFRIIMTFSAEFRPYIGVGTLAPWPTALGGLLPPWATALRPDAVARGATSGPR